MIIRNFLLLILHKNIRCDPSSEPSRRGSQHKILMIFFKLFHKENKFYDCCNEGLNI